MLNGCQNYKIFQRELLDFLVGIKFKLKYNEQGLF
jgi:hypothetical protein